MNVEYKRNRERRLDSLDWAREAPIQQMRLMQTCQTVHSPVTPLLGWVGGSVSVKKANQLLIPSLSIKAAPRKQSERRREKRRGDSLPCCSSGIPMAFFLLLFRPFRLLRGRKSPSPPTPSLGLLGQ